MWNTYGIDSFNSAQNDTKIKQHFGDRLEVGKMREDVNYAFQFFKDGNIIQVSGKRTITVPLILPNKSPVGEFVLEGKIKNGNNWSIHTYVKDDSVCYPVK